MQTGDALKYAFTGLAVLVFGYLAFGDVESRILGIVTLALVLWSLYPKRHLESSIVVIALIAFFEATLNVEGLIRSLIGTYGGSGLWIILAGFVLAKGMEVSGLGKRIALMIATSMGCKPANVVLAVALASFAITPLSPSTTAKAFIILPICLGLIESFGVEKGKSRFGASVMLMAMAANNICSTAFLTATIPNPISADYLSAIGVHLDWGNWVRMAFPVTILLLAASYLLVVWMFKPEVEVSKEAHDKVCSIRDGLGPLSRREKILTVTFSLSLILWISERYLPFNAGFASLLLSLLLFLPQTKVMEVGKFSNSVPWGSIMLFVASMFLARAVAQYRALDPVAESLFSALGLGGLPTYLFIGGTVLFAMMLHLIFTSTTVYATVMVPVVIGLTSIAGGNPAITGLATALLSPIAVILPINTIPNIIFFSEGWFTERQIVSYGLLLSLVSVVVVLLLGVPYWQLLGLI